MRLPTIRGVIDRRILVNYRADPEILTPLLPPPFRPKLLRGFGIVGICLIRLKQVRPAFLPSWLGIGSENAAHRFAVEWEEDGVIREGVYVRRRDTNSRINSLAGGRIFPGIHHLARYSVEEAANRFHVDLKSVDGLTRVSVSGRLVDRLPESSLFTSLEEASAFFQAGSLGYSATPDPSLFQGMELHCLNWRVEPLEVDEVRSSFFEDQTFFPEGSVKFDSALLMRGIQHEWQAKSDLCCPAQDSEGGRRKLVVS